MIRSKIIILLGFGSILVLVTMLIIVGVTNLNKSKLRLDKVVNQNNLKLQLVNQMRSAARERTISLQQMLIVDGEVGFENARTRMALYGGQFALSRSKFMVLELSPKEKEMMSNQAQLTKDVGPVQNEIADLVDFGEYKHALQLLVTKAIPLQDKVFGIFLQLQEIQRLETKKAIMENSENYKQIVGVMWIVSAVVIVICISIVFFTLRLIAKNERQQEAYRSDIERQAFYDHLTGLPNRRLLNDRIKHAIEKTERNEKLLAILFIDCDRFKPINDTLGHIVGDGLLVSIANRLKESVRSSDTVCRVSGDEFGIVLEDVDHISVVDRIAQNIIDSISAPHFIDGHKVFSTVSIGITIFPIDYNDVGGLLTSADIAMYHVKKNGGNHYEYYSTEMNLHSTQRLQLELDLHEALTKKQFEIFYQPLNAIDAERNVIGVEALLRWNHPRIGMIPPVDFIGIAEDTGLIVSIGEWVLMEACKQTKEWESQGLGEIAISVNLSPRQFMDSNLISFVENALNVSGLNPDQLDLEITESTAMQSIGKSIEILHKLKKLGVHISIDDFGTGYSSLSYLQQMPIDNLKIDRSFIKNLHHSAKDKAFVQAIVSMAHTLGMKTIAEGVELEEQFLFLKDIDCTVAQGFLFSKPVPPNQIKSLL
ncbi:MAG: EAL domain-containing protein [Gammaproteobacteria bacterium]|nr:EAL domain-containing protein [Gammaproteobacteria bacterium]